MHRWYVCVEHPQRLVSSYYGTRSVPNGERRTGDCGTELLFFGLALLGESVLRVRSQGKPASG